MAYNELTHFDDSGNAVMVDVSGKNITERIASASGCISMNEAAFVAGIMAVKKTSELIPLCHPLPIRKIGIDFALHPESRTVSAVCTVKTEDKTGVEMEALTGVSVALLTVYDMLKAVDKRMEINAVHLDEKHGGKSGDFMR